MDFNWSAFLFLWMFIVTCVADCYMMNDAIGRIDEFNRGKGLDKSRFVWLMVRIVACTAIVAGAIVLMCFFVKEHLFR